MAIAAVMHPSFSAGIEVPQSVRCEELLVLRDMQAKDIASCLEFAGNVSDGQQVLKAASDLQTTKMS